MTEGCKLDVVADRRGMSVTDVRFDSLDEELIARWRGEAGFAEHGYRSLATWFNKELLSQVYSDHGRETLGTRVDDEFEALREGEELPRQELLDDLAYDGIDGERLCDEMVSWSTVRTHLTDCLDAEKEREPARTNWEEESVEFAEERLLEKVSDALRSHQNKGQIADGVEAEASVQIRLACSECPTRVSLTEALNQGYVCPRHGPGE